MQEAAALYMYFCKPLDAAAGIGCTVQRSKQLLSQSSGYSLAPGSTDALEHLDCAGNCGAAQLASSSRVSSIGSRQGSACCTRAAAQQAACGSMLRIASFWPRYIHAKGQLMKLEAALAESRKLDVSPVPF